jgi:mitotic spindle assembly checkpoint protein MAD2B
VTCVFIVREPDRGLAHHTSLPHCRTATTTQMETPESYLAQLSHFTHFLTAYVHTLLYLRGLYPPASFVRSRFHNAPVHQSRHPAVCAWITDAISAVRDELLAGTVARIGIVVYWYSGQERSGSAKIMERYMVDVTGFPVVAKGERNMGIRWAEQELSSASGSDSEEGEDDGVVPWARDKGKQRARPPDADADVDMSEQFRAAFITLTTRCSQLAPLPKHCSYNISMELKDDADVDPPVAHPQPWIPVQSSLQKTGRHEAGFQDAEGGEDKREGQDLGGVRTTPIRTVEAGVLRFETWVEEGKAKFEMNEAAKSSFSSSAG